MHKAIAHREVDADRRKFASRIGSPATGLASRLNLARTLEGHDGCVNTCSFFPDGTRLISGSDDLSIRIWDWDRGAKRSGNCGRAGGESAPVGLW